MLVEQFLLFEENEGSIVIRSIWTLAYWIVNSSMESSWVKAFYKQAKTTFYFR